MINSKPFCNVERTAELTGLTKCFIRKLIKERKCPIIMVGRCILIDVNGLVEALQEEARKETECQN